MTQTNLSPKAQASLDRVIERFESGDLSPLVKVATFRPPEDWPAASWSFGNRVMSFAQADSLHIRGYRQWEKVGRNVKRGGQAVFIWSPLTYQAENDDGEKETRIRGFKSTPVFPADQTEGETPLSDLEPEYTPAELPPLMDVADAFGVTVTWTASPGDRRGDYRPGQKKIRINTDDVKTFFHELAHAAHDKLNNLTGANLEVLAEFTACVLMELYELGDRSGNAWQYISAYSKDPIKAIMKAMATIEEVLQLITEEVKK